MRKTSWTFSRASSSPSRDATAVEQHAGASRPTRELTRTTSAREERMPEQAAPTVQSIREGIRLPQVLGGAANSQERLTLSNERRSTRPNPDLGARL